MVDGRRRVAAFRAGHGDVEAYAEDPLQRHLSADAAQADGSRSSEAVDSALKLEPMGRRPIMPGRA